MFEELKVFDLLDETCQLKSLSGLNFLPVILQMKKFQDIYITEKKDTAFVFTIIKIEGMWKNVKKFLKQGSEVWFYMGNMICLVRVRKLHLIFIIRVPVEI